MLSAQIITFPVPRAAPSGCCPRCGMLGGNFELGGDRWDFCTACGVKWRSPRASYAELTHAEREDQALVERARAMGDLIRSYAFETVSR